MNELIEAAERLAVSLEAAVPLCTTRIEHVRVAGHALEARRIADGLRAATAPAVG